jgi:4a-hydroxytetrahydrobiopterin dehydratase
MARDKTQLTKAELDAFLSSHAGWKVEGGELTRTFERPTFVDAIAFVQKVAALAEAQQHHPDIDIRYRNVTLKLVTHDADGITWRDTQLAGDCDAL